MLTVGIKGRVKGGSKAVWLRVGERVGIQGGLSVGRRIKVGNRGKG
jgi:hypothetical protein